ncbi:PREDICTED: uncharacterized protein LOC109228063 [Nicotiana attenuata]|uniref:uncharacterized protein LOC109228063 n=1 Tax=Nicotiana attenuata TaxID=49451 RepID=UPI0009057021|nr:PREDICTED: uncharacterized protein LOC109228063 [Nicotiana attenuata]
MVTVRIVINVAASKGWPLFQMDVNKAYLQGDLTESLYGFTSSSHDHSLFTKKYGKNIVIILVYVDDLLKLGILTNPKQSHLDAVLREVRYNKGSPCLGILLKKGETNNLTVFCDSDWAVFTNTRRSTIGYIVKLGDFLLSWKSKKQQTSSRSLA